MITLSFSKPIIEQLYQELATAAKLNNLRLYKMVQGLLWVGEGESLRVVAERLHISVRTVDNWRRRFLVRGLGGLLGYHYRGRGRKAKLTPEQQHPLYDWVVAGPEAQGFTCGIWNTALLVELIWLRFGVRYNPHYLSSLLKKLGLSYQKARLISDRHDEEAYERARRQWVNETWPQIVRQAQATGAVILLVDEVSFALWGSLSDTWAPRGQQPRVKTTGIRKGLKRFGAISVQEGTLVYREARAYTLTAKAFKHRQAAGVPATVLSALAGLKNVRYGSQEAFQQAVETCLGTSLCPSYQTLLWPAAEGSGQFTGATYIEFLQQLLEHFTTPILLIDDGASYHRSQEVQTFQATQAARLTVYPLPAFSPDFNPIEKLWRNTKKAATHLKYFKTFEQLRASVQQAFQQYLEDATQVIRVMKKLRTTAGIA